MRLVDKQKLLIIIGKYISFRLHDFEQTSERANDS